MADTSKKLVQIQVLATVQTENDDQARVLGGNLVRIIQANMPQQFEIVGVELQDITETDRKDEAESETRHDRNKARGATDKTDTTLKT